ncbi:MAG: sodium:proton antiporter [Lachnospiraceae bacterium]|nr:sodium:proton antiporter [Lachnospiraceae bacterium]
MDFIMNFPFFSIMLCMIAAIAAPVLPGKIARKVTLGVFTAVFAMSVALLVYLGGKDQSFVYYMGHFPAPWGNEIRAGALEAVMAIFVSFIGIFSLLGGLEDVLRDLEESKINLYCVLLDLVMSSLLAMIYTNDLFTAYVFIEINTIAGCGLIMIRRDGRSKVTAVRYMTVSLLGSGLFLMGVVMTYSITGHLLMSNIQTSVAGLVSSGDYNVALTVVIGLMTVGISIKSGLYPFHLWIPDAYGYSNVASSAILSSIVSKGYIFLLIKIYLRVFGFDTVVASKVLNVVFFFGIVGIIMGSVMAIRERNVRKIIAYSSVAQIGYIYMGIGLGTVEGLAAAVFHILAHGVTKALLFISSADFTERAGAKKLAQLDCLGRKYRFSALTFSVGALSITGFPLLAGFISKILFTNAAIGQGYRMYFAIFALAVSTALNAVYFLRMVTKLYSTSPEKGAEVARDLHAGEAAEPSEEDGAGELTVEGKAPGRLRILHYIAVIALVAANFYLGLRSRLITDIIEKGLSLFS